jgi:spermidine synthase
MATTVLFHDDDPTGTVVVTSGNSRSIITNGKSDGNLRIDYTTMALAGLVPALLCDDPARALVIGWGLGVTAGELGSLDDVKEVVAVEISPGVLEAAPLFDAGNQNASTNPKIQTIRSDAYRALLRSEGQFGVIASEPSNPWVMGVEMLFSEEFLRAARDRLIPGGVYAQWFHLYEVDEATLKIVLRTFRAVFGDMAIWFTMGSDVLLLGFKDPTPALDIDRLRARFERADFRAGFGRAAVGSWIQLLAHEIVPLGAVAATEMAGPLHTLRHPILSDSAARAFFAGGRVPVPRMPSVAASQAAARNSLLKRELAGNQPSEDVLEELTRHACAMLQPVECALLLARWTASHPDSPRLVQTTKELRSADHLSVSANALSASTIEALVKLHRGHPLTSPESPGPVNNAVTTSSFYAAYFHHAFPFDRSVVIQAWSKCVADPRTVSACTAERRQAEQTLGPIYPKSAPPEPQPRSAAPVEQARLREQGRVPELRQRPDSTGQQDQIEPRAVGEIVARERLHAGRRGHRTLRLRHRHDPDLLLERAEHLERPVEIEQLELRVEHGSQGARSGFRHLPPPSPQDPPFRRRPQGRRPLGSCQAPNRPGQAAVTAITRASARRSETRPMQHERIRTSIQVEIRASGRVAAGTVRNASDGGMFVETSAIPPQGESVALRFSSRGAVTHEVTGMVWWTTEGSAHRHKRRGFGLRLLEEDEGYSRMLAGLQPGSGSAQRMSAQRRMLAAASAATRDSEKSRRSR